MQTTPSPALNQVDVPTTPANSDPGDIDSVYQNLVSGVGHEQVTDDNVEELIRRADADKHPVLAAELREWRSATGEDANIDLDPAHRS
ncbi:MULTISPECIES: hypothetical protein [unclassified Roseateles]|uniref:hypothetical protein n=1 Tax=unclassified Roseateles TaxID=2626991 RepID=UPI0006F91FF3|nr:MULTISPECIES: hypothetical protein [unclassified Roseateles]KQW44633.1 hypothetical protein ASC81_13635 [Pelomonas sp. Root405]KRA69992.1 hypothetical protein ASD88_17795 [Pelomonas sp. Root662]